MEEILNGKRRRQSETYRASKKLRKTSLDESWIKDDFEEAIDYFLQSETRLN